MKGAPEKRFSAEKACAMKPFLQLARASKLTQTQMRHVNGSFLITHHQNEIWNVTAWGHAGQSQFQTASNLCCAACLRAWALQTPKAGNVQDAVIYLWDCYTRANTFSQGTRIPAASPQISHCCRQHVLPPCQRDCYTQDQCQCIAAAAVHGRSPQTLWNEAPVQFSRWKALLDLNQRSFSKLWGNSCE